jgi:hypothetical protein
MEAKFSDLLGKTLTTIVNENDELIFTTNEGEMFKSYHEQECCESVSIEDIEGDLNDLIGTPILQAEEVTNSEDTFDKIEYPDLGTWTWTFYKLATIKGYVTIRWLGESNGFYSESVSFLKANKNGEFLIWD